MIKLHNETASAIADLINSIHVATDMINKGYDEKLWNPEIAEAYIKLGDIYGIKCPSYKHYKKQANQ